MKILPIQNNLYFKGVMHLSLEDEKHHFSKYIETTPEDDNLFMEKIPNKKYMDDKTIISDKGEEIFEVSELIKNICIRNKIYFPKLDLIYDWPQLYQTGNKINYQAGSETGRECKLRDYKYDWKLIMADIDLRSAKEIKESTNCLLENVTNHPEISDSEKERVKEITKKLSVPSVSVAETAEEESYLSMLLKILEERKDLPF